MRQSAVTFKAKGLNFEGVVALLMILAVRFRV